MKTSLFIALRYFFSPKSTHAVNIIAIVSVTGIAIVTLAMVCVLSVFNGFEQFATSQLSVISPEYKIVERDGHYFSPSEAQAALTPLQKYTGFEIRTPAVAQHKGNQQIVTVVGIDPHYLSLIPLQQYLYDGEINLGTDSLPTAVLEMSVGASIGALYGSGEPLTLVVPRRTGQVSLTMPQRSFRHLSFPIAGTLKIDQIEAVNTLYAPISAVRELLMLPPDQVEAIVLGPLSSTEEHSLRQSLPSHLQLLPRVEQHPDVYKVIKVEKWIAFALLLFVLFLSLFSVISTLGMLIIEKHNDYRTLRILGAPARLLDRIILFEGWLLSISGLIIGLIIGIALVLSQQQWGWLTLGNSNSDGIFLLSAYPVRLLLTDLIGVGAVILTIGWGSSMIAYRIFARFHED